MRGAPSGGGMVDVLVDAQGHLQVDILSLNPGTGSTDLGKAEDSVHVSGDTGVFVLGVRNDAINARADDGDYIPFQMDSFGSLQTNVLGIVPGTSAGNLGKADDSARASGDSGVSSLGVRNDTRGSLVSADGDYTPFQTNSSGDLRVDGSAVTQPVSGTVTVEQSTHNSLNANANIQVADTDVSTSNPVPIEGFNAEGASATAQNPVTIAGKDLSGNNMIPTIQTVGAVNANISIMSDGAGNIPSVSNAGLNANGDEAHDAADAGNPLKIGVKAIDYEPDTEDEQGPAEVAADDRANVAANLRGELILGTNKAYHLFDGTFPNTGLDGTYNNTNTSSTSESVECWNYTHFIFGWELSKANTPTDITVRAEISYDGTNWFKYTHNGWGLWIESDTAVGDGISRAYGGDLYGARFIRFVVTAVGTTAVNTFTVDNSFVSLRNGG